MSLAKQQQQMVEINIETLAGTTFSLKCSLSESIQSVKAKIQRLEGIPISHQHLIWQSNELSDGKSLNDYNITDGSTIKMVLSLRGGPINTRRMTTEETLLRDVSDLIEIREDSNLWNSNSNSKDANNNSNSQNGDMPSSYPLNKHITLLLFRDGEHLNLLKVVDRCEEASPTSGAMSAASMYLPCEETDVDQETDNGIIKSSSSPTKDNAKFVFYNESASDKLAKIKKIDLRLATISANRRKKLAITSENEKTRQKMKEIQKKLFHLRKKRNLLLESAATQRSMHSARGERTSAKVKSHSINSASTAATAGSTQMKSSTTSLRKDSNATTIQTNDDDFNSNNIIDKDFKKPNNNNTNNTTITTTTMHDEPMKVLKRSGKNRKAIGKQNKKYINIYETILREKDLKSTDLTSENNNKEHQQQQHNASATTNPNSRINMSSSATTVVATTQYDDLNDAFLLDPNDEDIDEYLDPNILNKLFQKSNSQYEIKFDSPQSNNGTSTAFNNLSALCNDDSDDEEEEAFEDEVLNVDGYTNECVSATDIGAEPDDDEEYEEDAEEDDDDESENENNEYMDNYNYYFDDYYIDYCNNDDTTNDGNCTATGDYEDDDDGYEDDDDEDDEDDENEYDYYNESDQDNEDEDNLRQLESSTSLSNKLDRSESKSKLNNHKNCECKTDLNDDDGLIVHIRRRRSKTAATDDQANETNGGRITNSNCEYYLYEYKLVDDSNEAESDGNLVINFIKENEKNLVKQAKLTKTRNEAKLVKQSSQSNEPSESAAMAVASKESSRLEFNSEAKSKPLSRSTLIEAKRNSEEKTTPSEELLGEKKKVNSIRYLKRNFNRIMSDLNYHANFIYNTYYQFYVKVLSLNDFNKCFKIKHKFYKNAIRMLKRLLCNCISELKNQIFNSNTNNLQQSELSDEKSTNNAQQANETENQAATTNKASNVQQTKLLFDYNLIYFNLKQHQQMFLQIQHFLQTLRQNDMKFNKICETEIDYDLLLRENLSDFKLVFRLLRKLQQINLIGHQQYLQSINNNNEAETSKTPILKSKSRNSSLKTDNEVVPEYVSQSKRNSIVEESSSQASKSILTNYNEQQQQQMSSGTETETKQEEQATSSENQQQQQQQQKASVNTQKKVSFLPSVQTKSEENQIQYVHDNELQNDDSITKANDEACQKEENEQQQQQQQVSEVKKEEEQKKEEAIIIDAQNESVDKAPVNEPVIGQRRQQQPNNEFNNRLSKFYKKSLDLLTEEILKTPVNNTNLINKGTNSAKSNKSSTESKQNDTTSLVNRKYEPNNKDSTANESGLIATAVEPNAALISSSSSNHHQQLLVNRQKLTNNFNAAAKVAASANESDQVKVENIDKSSRKKSQSLETTHRSQFSAKNDSSRGHFESSLSIIQTQITDLKQQFESGSTNSLKLPPIILQKNTETNTIEMIHKEKIVGKKSSGKHCYFCKKKTGLASSYICRCGNNFCTQHRNAEAHNCTYDYKTEGKKLIEHSNPLVAAPKLPKI